MCADMGHVMNCTTYFIKYTQLYRHGDEATMTHITPMYNND